MSSIINVDLWHFEIKKASINDGNIILSLYGSPPKGKTRYEIRCSMPWSFTGYLKDLINKRIIQHINKFKDLLHTPEQSEKP